MTEFAKQKELRWSVNTPGLLREITCNPHTEVLGQPLNIFANKLHEVAKRAAEVNDPKSNLLMLELALYEAGDPYSDNYDSEIIEKLRIEVGNEK